MDPRCEPTQFLGPGLRGVLKNAGGRATPDAVRSILVLRSLIKKTEKGTVAVIHHTGKLFLFDSRTYTDSWNPDCGMTHLTDEGILEDIRKRTPDAAASAEGIDFGCFTADDFEETIRKDVQTLKAEKLLEGVEILGLAFDTDTGDLKVVYE